MKHFSLFSLFFILSLTVTSAVAAEYHYVTPETMKSWLDEKQPITIVDIQIEKDYVQHHLPGSIATYAYPVKTDQQRTAIDKAVEQYKKDGKNMIIVCPRGAGGAKRCYDYLKASDVPEEKLVILKGGAEGWPYKEMFVSGK